MTRKLSEAVREPLGGAAEPWVIDGIEGLESRLETVRQQRDTLAELVDHVLRQFDRMHTGDLAESDMDALAWEKRARAVREAMKG